MKLSILERIVILNLLPAKGDFITLRVAQEARETLDFTSAEQGEYEFKTDGGRINWNPSKDPHKEFSISKAAMDLVVEKLKELDSKKELEAETFPLYERFVAGPRLVSEESNG